MLKGDAMKSVTIVVPVFNEEDNLRHFTAAIAEVMQTLPYTYQLILVDDGSSDSSCRILPELAREDAHVRVIALSRNYGHQLALTCGIDHADGDAVITMDGDMQHPPALLPVLLEKWEQGYEVVQTIRQTTEGVSAFKRLTSKYYYRLLNCVSDVPVQPGGSDFRLMDRKAVAAFRRYREQDRFIRGLVGAMGFRQVQVPFVAPNRYAGQSKFSLKKMVKFAFDGILGNSVLPLRCSLYLGCIFAVLSIGLFLHAVLAYLLHEAVPGWTTIIACMSMFGGAQLIVLGILGEYIARIFRAVKNRPLYLIEYDTAQKQPQ